ncbi:stage V sporulation protein AA [Mesobacillus harenae]|uniref:stage V sporulation protein AA n=1 Tax=Mesobacillus harenae TaxID=2213203 RepID=UPI00157FCD8C|nr:stage V sporulation protein AA [Mesobacillus harenae]
MEKTIYIRMRTRLHVFPNQSVYLKDIAQIISSEHIFQELSMLPVYKVSPKDNNLIVLDIMKVIGFITERYPAIEIQTMGAPQTIIEVVYKRNKLSPVFVVLIWFLLFLGAALTIMNFHEDVSMQEVQQRLYTIMTGKYEAKPLLFQIPYSFGIGLGMILFFNHLFRKRINEEPSPLEVEMFNYQQALDQYVAVNENKESIKQLDDH